MRYANRTKKIRSFPDQLRRRISANFPWQKRSSIFSHGEGVSFRKEHKDELFSLIEQVAEDDIETFNDGLLAYASADTELMDFLGASLDRIKQLPSLKDTGFIQKVLMAVRNIGVRSDVYHDDPEVYYGRDARWLYLARKAQMLGLPRRNHLKYIIASRNILESDKFDEYVLGKDIPFDAYHIDVGAHTGRGVRRVLKVIAHSPGCKLTEKEFLQRARFLSAASLPRLTQLFPERDSAVLVKNTIYDQVLDLIELRVIGDRPNTFRRYSNGVLEPDFNPGAGALFNSYSLELQAWAMEQAVIRHFLPKEVR